MNRADPFARIARRYDRVNALLSAGRHQAWIRAVVDILPQGRVLDLGAGTGVLARTSPRLDVVAADPSLQMLALNPSRRLVAAVGERLPFRNGVFDAVFASYVMRNLDSVEETLVEVARVLRSGGALGVVGLGRPQGRVARRVHRLGTAVTLPAVGLMVGAPREYAYLHRSLDKLPQPEDIYVDGPLRLEELWRMGWMGFVYGAVLRKP